MLGLDPYPRTAATCPHQVCGSIDSGYDHTSLQISQSSKTNQETPVIDVERSLSASLLSSQRSKQQSFLEEQSSQPKQR